MKKGIKSFVITAIILLIIGTSFAYATSSVGSIGKVETQKEESFFYIDKEETYAGDMLTMTIDLSKISNSEFEFNLSSNIEVKKVISNEIDGTSINVDTNNNEMKITADKSKLNVDKIQLYYQVPENVKIGDSITFYASISFEEETNEDILSNIILENSIQGNIIQQGNNEILQNSKEESNIIKEETQIIVKIIEKEETINEDTSKEESDNNLNLESNNNNLNVENVSNNSSNMNINKTVSTIASSTSAETVTYNGSYDNYLTNITVEGYNLTPDFSKTNHTYFLNVENTVESIDVNVEKSDSSASVVIYGNTNLEIGENKVLISVTAENGNVRIYRIYVTRQSK